MFLMASDITTVKTLDIKDYIPRSVDGDVIANAPPIIELGPRTLVVVAYDNFTVRESADYVMHLIACALGAEQFDGQRVEV